MPRMRLIGANPSRRSTARYPQATSMTSVKTDDADRGAQTELQGLKEAAVRIDGEGLGGVGGTAAGQDEHDVERPERVERAKEERDEQHGSSSGSVIRRNAASAPAPSTWAASYRSGEIDRSRA